MKKILIIDVTEDDLPISIKVNLSGSGTLTSYDCVKAKVKVNQFTPPSDEEIEKEANKHYEYELYNDVYFRRGAEWIKTLLQ